MGNKITHLPLLDLRHLASLDELKSVEEIAFIGTILLSNRLKDNIYSISMHHVGSVVTVPSDKNVKLVTGSTRIGGAFLENAGGDPDALLLVVGEMVVTSPFAKVGYSSVIVTGELFAPKASESVLAQAISQLNGELYFYEREPLVLTGRDWFGHEFFACLEEPVTLILRGDFQIEADVSPDLLREKVAAVYLWGNVQTVSSSQSSVLLARTVVKYGDIRPEQASEQATGQATGQATEQA